ncbi:prolyl 4-hydroxylase alpha-like protein [Medicago truncatula]|uniref:procollagen-proline 4-dioxygenase n=1 Tax=Medicago truncatula TaxID=3880 RepID=G7LB34_MEDTR|nr:prolyl 4-hydroxylase alpha-like protein [Medicago truncatula]
MGKLKHSRVGPRKPLLPTSRTLIFTLFVTFIFLIIFLILLSLRIPKPKHLNSITHINNLRRDDDDNKRWVEIVSWEPRVFLYHNFLAKEECEHLINIAKPDVQKSTVVDDTTGKSVNSSARTSSGTFIDRGYDKILSDIEKRIADFTFIPVEHGEDVNILHYEVGQKYDFHTDYFEDEVNTKHGGERIATMLMYLSDVEEGGETVFPSAKGNFSSVPWWNELSDCGKKGLSIKPKMGNAILFWGMKPDATVDPLSVHGACPVIKGDKWSCTKWMRVGKW